MGAPVTTTFEAEMAANNANNLFKALGGIIYTAEMTVPIPASFTSGATGDMLALSAESWKKLGMITKGDGVTFSRDMSNDEEEAWGYNEPVRTDITTDTTSAAFTLMEQNRSVLEMYDFVDLSSVTPDATSGEWGYNKPLMSALKFRRILFMAVDGAGTDRRYRFKVMPRAQVTGVSDEAWMQSASTKFPFTIRATVDPALGYAVRNVFAGPGQKARNVGAGFGV